MVAEEWLRPGWRVADPFVGAGALLLAAKRRGCEVVGCDVDGDHVETARDALQDDLMDGCESAHGADEGAATCELMGAAGQGVAGHGMARLGTA